MLFVIQVENNTPVGLPYAYDNFLHMYPGVEYSEIHTVGYAPWVPTDMPLRPLKKQLIDSEIKVHDLGLSKQIYNIEFSEINEAGASQK